jgi:hypothetical protein
MAATVGNFGLGGRTNAQLIGDNPSAGIAVFVRRPSPAPRARRTA